MKDPTNNALLFQHVHSKSGCSQWVALTAPRTLKYCMDWNIDYHLIVGDVDGYIGGVGHWTVTELLQGYLQIGYDRVIYLDADCIIANLEVDLRDACVIDKIGLVWHDLSYHDPDWSHYNAGALYVSNTQIIRDFVVEWLEQKPGSPAHPWYDQGVLNILGKERGIINHLDNKWNAGHVSPSENPVVLGLHGFPDRYISMQKHMQDLEHKESLR